MLGGITTTLCGGCICKGQFMLQCGKESVAIASIGILCMCTTLHCRQRHKMFTCPAVGKFKNLPSGCKCVERNSTWTSGLDITECTKRWKGCRNLIFSWFKYLSKPIWSLKLLALTLASQAVLMLPWFSRFRKNHRPNTYLYMQWTRTRTFGRMKKLTTVGQTAHHQQPLVFLAA